MSFENTTVLVTGGAGFIGSHLVARLLDAGASVRVLDDLSTGRRENLRPHLARIDLHEASVTEPEACRAACEGVDYVLHQASLPSVQRSVTDPRPTHEVSATGTLNMLNASSQAGVRRFVYAGSSSAYGDTPKLPKHEDMAACPRSPYAVAKLAGEHYTRVYPALFGLETVILRYFNVFGPRQDPRSPYSAAIPVFIDAALDRRAPTIHGDGGQTRDFTYVDNVVDANMRACLADGGAVVGEVFNIGCGERVSIGRVWEEIRRILGVDVEAERGPARSGEVRDSLADLTKSRERLGYAVRVSLAEGLRRTVDWLRRERDGSVPDRAAS
jgi:UDP-N-acetylglucosamine 4-epimerase